MGVFDQVLRPEAERAAQGVLKFVAEASREDRKAAAAEKSQAGGKALQERLKAKIEEVKAMEAGR